MSRWMKTTGSGAAATTTSVLPKMTTMTTTPLGVIWQLARESLAQRDRIAAAGYVMTPMPYEGEVRAMLAREPSDA